MGRTCEATFLQQAAQSQPDIRTLPISRLVSGRLPMSTLDPLQTFGAPAHKHQRPYARYRLHWAWTVANVADGAAVIEGRDRDE